MSTCPLCGHGGNELFYCVHDQPVNSTLLMPTRDHAIHYPCGDIWLALCRRCGFIWNDAFNDKSQEYSSQCEESQGFSPKFQDWLEDLALRLINRLSLNQKKVLEIGCGKGDFLALLCELGDNRGVGYDPALAADRLPASAKDLMQVYECFWERSHGLHDADLIACRHTLEHIPDVAGFMRDVRDAIGDSDKTLLFFEVPDAHRILKDGAFQDIYYEHCSYFTRASLQRLFIESGFSVIDCWQDFHDQYLCLTARPRARQHTEQSDKLELENTAELAGMAGHFEKSVERLQQSWREKLSAWSDAGLEVVVWGGGSKAVAFLNQVDSARNVSRVIDINPNKHDAFVPGSGQPVLAPQALNQQPADVVIVMNSVYLTEVAGILRTMQQEPELAALI